MVRNRQVEGSNPSLGAKKELRFPTANKTERKTDSVFPSGGLSPSLPARVDIKNGEVVKLVATPVP